MNRKIPFSIDEFYHIYNRGNSRQPIFLSNDDYDRFTKLLYLCNSTKNINFREDIVEQKIDAYDFDRREQIVTIGAWVLMPNHFHIYLTISQRSDLGDDSISVFIKKLCTAYSMYFNKKYGRTGSLFEGKFKSTHVNFDEYVKYLYSYIHLNPIKLIDPKWKENGIVDKQKVLNFLEGYIWGSYLDYIGVNRPENKIINPNDFPGYFTSKESIENEIFDWLTLPSSSQRSDLWEVFP